MPNYNKFLLLGVSLLVCSCTSTTTTKKPAVEAELVSHQGQKQVVTPHQTDEFKRPSTKAMSPQVTDQSLDVTPSHDDVWGKIRAGLHLDRHLGHRTVQDKLRWYKRNQDYLDRVADRARPYLYHIVSELERRNMPMELALLPIVESAYHPFAYSRSRASGIWQFIPGTGKIYGLKQNWWYDGRRDIVAATDAALRYLDKLQKEFNGNWLHALAAYNSGERNVARAISRNQRAGKDIDFFSLRLPRETRGYVPSLLAVTELLSDPTRYGVNWKEIKNEPYFEIIDVQQQIDLATAADIASLTMDELYTLNPGFNRWATDPDGPHRLLIPINVAEKFRAQLDSLAASDRVNWQRHVIKRGETLGAIAARYRTSVDTLKQTNRLRGTRIYEGKSILIPVASHPSKHYTLSLDNRRFRGLKKVGSGEKYIYTIVRGDTLWDIGRQYGVSVNQLVAWNGMTRNSILRPGQKLTLWFDKENSDPANTVIATAATSTDSTFSYTVRRGDSLWLISRKHGVTVTQLLRWNNLSSKKFLQPGQKIIIQRKVATNTET